MASFIIEGGHRLNGDLIPQGAKNEALEVLCATLLTPEEVKIYNIPDILDVNNLIQLLRDLGVTVKRIGLNAYSFKADKINLDYLDSDEFFKRSFFAGIGNDYRTACGSFRVCRFTETGRR